MIVVQKIQNFTKWKARAAVPLFLWAACLTVPALSSAYPRVSAEALFTPALAPAANGKIAFASNRDGDYEIYVTAVDGNGLAKLTNNTADDFDPAWSPDGTKIAFVSNRDGNYEIYLMNGDGSGQLRVTNSPGNELDPAWSPDGKKLAFTTNRDGNEEVYVMNADGSGQTNLSRSSADDSFPAWSPDGTRIAFTTDREGDFEIYVMQADGSAQANLSQSPTDDAFAAWSPDGGKIAMASDRDGDFEIYVMNADGSGQTRLTNSTREDTFPAWSPDGTKIVFMVGNFVGGQIVDNDVYVMSADGTVRTIVTNDPADDIYPSWQPLPATPTPTPTPTPIPTPTPTATPAPKPIQLILEDNGPTASQAAALEGVFFLRDPFPVVNSVNLLKLVSDPNTRVMVFVTSVVLLPGENPAAVIVHLTDSANQSFAIPAEDVRLIPGAGFTQVLFRLPTGLAVGTCTITISAPNQLSNSATIRIRSG